MERIKKFTAGPDDAGLRVDRAVLFHVDGVSRALLQKAIHEGLLTVNGLPVKPSDMLRPGDKVVLRLAPREPLQLQAQALPLEIMYEDKQLVVINKPAGLVVHPGAGVADGTLANALVHYFGHLPGTESLRPGIIHRLDKETSGLLLVTRTEESMLRLSAMFQKREIYKEYVALVYGTMEAPHGIIDLPIGRHPVHRMKMTVHAPRGRASRTEWFVEQAYAGLTLLRVVLHTGRTHQIRVHLSARSHPIVGDGLYGGNRPIRIRQGGAVRTISPPGRFFLHARRLRFLNPWTGREMEFHAPLPDDLARFLERLPPPEHCPQSRRFRR
ncbi:MAG TPA: RluA family pseudouridine synthase [Acidobacteriota bacterium]|nr:RluA family pseudouridine synthase [Acidobacteriota bacterium]HQM62827.1 RluA family pseudouridine synthase [Acidobacteriota bacterium]